MPSDNPAALLLDTHIWYWLANGDPALDSSETLDAIERAVESGHATISAITLLEVCMLEEKGRIRLQMDRLEWIRRALESTGVELVPLSPEVAAESTRLPGDMHGDPADRIIAATARLTGSTLVTRDGKLLAYAKRGFIRALEA